MDPSPLPQWIRLGDFGDILLHGESSTDLDLLYYGMSAAPYQHPTAQEVVVPLKTLPYGPPLILCGT